MTKIYIGGLPYSATESELRDEFTQYGNIQDAVVITDRETGRSRGFGFVTFSDAGEATAACEKNGADMGGRTLKVSIAQDRRR